jgi:alkylhydroperoxidase family enzyme
MLGIRGPEPEQVALDHTATNLPLPFKALLNFALRLNNEPSKITSRDVDALRTFGFNDQQILETVIAVGFAKFANFVAFGLGTVPDFDSSKVALAGRKTAG